jgi:uncharacterized membrane protein
VGHVLPLSRATYYSLLGISLLIGFQMWGKLPARRDLPVRLREACLDVIPCALVFLVTQHLALSWPDFYPVGERLRDYSLIASVVHDPISSAEPWFSGVQTTYYLYWYRFGQAIQALLNLEVWDTYHFLNAWGVTFLWSATYLLTRRLGQMTHSTAGFVATVVCFGSNVAGLHLWLKQDVTAGTWWGPSRVIKGAIDEFPAWSFLLGDNHPHFLSYGFASFCIALLLGVAKDHPPTLTGAIHYFCLFAVTLLLLLNGNAWEVPMWLGTGVLMGVFFLYRFFRQGRFTDLVAKQEIRWTATLPYLVLTLVAVSSLLWSSRTISSGETPISLVAGRAPISTTKELLFHWGVPLGALAFSQLLLLRNPLFVIPILFAHTVAVLTNDGVLFLTSLLVVELTRAALLMHSPSPETAGDVSGSNEAIIRALSVATLGLLLMCEVLFLDDPYGGENERMNTIFKTYAFCWPILHVLAAVNISQVWNRWCPRISSPEVQLVGWALRVSGTFALAGFFIVVARSIRPKDSSGTDPEGLTRIDREMPGSAATIRHLRSAPRGTILESQTGAYNWSTHVATLVGFPAYLGWANHVRLLIRNGEDVTHREKMIESIYTGTSCEQIVHTLHQEHITYVVLGPLERKAYGENAGGAFSCMGVESSFGGYTVYRSGAAAAIEASLAPIR